MAEFDSPHRRQGVLDRCSAVEAIFRRFAREERMPGVSFGVLVNDELVYADGLGTLNIAHEHRPTADSVFRIASMTKSFTAAAVLILRDAGRLRLDEAAERYVPELATLQYPSSDSPAVTVRDLLTMSAGWPQDDPWGDRQLHRTDAAMSEIYAEGASFSNPPGVSFEYSNLGYMILGRVISVVSGEGAMQFITRNLLEPLEMTSTLWACDEASGNEVAQGYRWEDDVWREEQRMANGGDVAAFAGLYSTVRDLSCWVGLFQSAWPARDAAETGPLSRASLREMQRIWQTVEPSLAFDRHGTAEMVTGGYGYGLSMGHNGSYRTAGHGGGLPGYGSHMRWAPDHGIGVVALANVTYANVHDACDEAIDKLVEATGVTTRTTFPSQSLARYFADVCRLMNGWQETLASALFADNFFLDFDTTHWRARLEKLSERHGRFETSGAIEAENWLRGRATLPAERGWCEVWITLSPTLPPKVQTLKIRSVLPPPATLSEAASALAEFTAKPRRAALDKLLARGADRDDVWRQLNLMHLSYGRCHLQHACAGDGVSQATFELRAGSRKLRLKLAANASGKLVSVSFEPTR